MTGSKPSTKKLFLSVGKASEVLGVSEATLRHWTDEGRVRAFVTPGGHRRYSAHELERFAKAHRTTQSMGKRGGASGTHSHGSPKDSSVLR